MLDCNPKNFDSFIASVGEHNAGAELANYVDNTVVHYFNHMYNTLETKVNNASILSVKLNSSAYNGIFTYLHELYRVEYQNINKWHAIQRALGK